ncbi:hypothetical protein CK203_044894 [Vitis vinifera]|uniref:DUF4283 domain-containing protein n=1 Tax=Vitis vinifera TaxID=29760 RepID=A0A438H0D7_VITVI|nr:hypothetical protein CK203_044894 [Vitis vinifera]
MDLKGERCWFAVDSKTFDLSIKVVRGKLKGLIVERGKGLSAWIRFGEVSLGRLLERVEACCRELLEGVEACCREEGALRWNTVWRMVGGDFVWSGVRME